MLFLIDYDRRAGKIVQLQRFSDDQQSVAIERRLELELLHHRDRVEREVVLLEARDEAAIRTTHRRYFDDLSELVKLPPRNGKPA